MGVMYPGNNRNPDISPQDFRGLSDENEESLLGDFEYWFVDHPYRDEAAYREYADVSMINGQYRAVGLSEGINISDGQISRGIVARAEIKIKNGEQWNLPENFVIREEDASERTNVKIPVSYEDYDGLVEICFMEDGNDYRLVGFSQIKGDGNEYIDLKKYGK